MLILAGALLGAAVGGALGYTAAGLTGAGIGLGVGALAGFGLGATVQAFRPIYYYPVPYPYYGNCCAPVCCCGPRLYYTRAY